MFLGRVRTLNLLHGDHIKSVFWTTSRCQNAFKLHRNLHYTILQWNVKDKFWNSKVKMSFFKFLLDLDNFWVFSCGGNIHYTFWPTSNNQTGFKLDMNLLYTILQGCFSENLKFLSAFPPGGPPFPPGTPFPYLRN